MDADRPKLWLLVLTVFSAGVTLPLAPLNFLLLVLGIASVMIITSRYGYGYGVLACFGSLALAILLYGLIGATVLIVLMIVPGLIMGNRARAFESPSATIAWGLLPFVLPVFLVVLFQPQIAAYAPTLVEDLRFRADSIARSWGLNDQQSQQWSESAAILAKVVLTVLPGILTTIFVGLVFLAYLVATAAGPKFGTMIPTLGALSSLRAHEFWLMPTGVALVLVLTGRPWLKTIGFNLLIFLVHVYAFYGFCLIEYFLQRASPSWGMRLLVYLPIALLAGVFVPLLALCGVIDSRFDLRKIGFKHETI